MAYAPLDDLLVTRAEPLALPFDTTPAPRPQGPEDPPPIATDDDPPRRSRRLAVRMRPAADDVPLPAVVEPGEPLDVGGRVGRFRLTARIGAGGMGVVYRAYDQLLERSVALKILKGAADAVHHLRMNREAQALARFAHANVVQIYEAGEVDGRVYLVMELIPGRGLDSWQAEPRAIEDILDVYIRTGAGLAAAHDAGVLHRDFKPSNVILGDDGRPRIIDFGLARAPGLTHRPGAGFGDDLRLDDPLTQEGTMVGTPAYMAPEQFWGDTLDERADQFSFCVCLFEAIWGVPPFPRDSMLGLIDAIRHRRLAEPDGPPGATDALRRIVLRGLDADLSRRWPSMAALLEALDTERCREPESSRRHRRRLVAAVGFVVLGLTSVALSRGPAAIEPGTSIVYGLVAFLVVLVLVAARRRTVLASPVGRAFAGFAAAGTAAVVGIRAISWALDVEPVAMYAIELVALASLAAVSTAGTRRRFWVVSALLALGAGAVVLAPGLVAAIYSGVLAATCAATAWLMTPR